jgi:hypothetical protein
MVRFALQARHAVHVNTLAQAKLNNTDFKRWYQSASGLWFIFFLCMISFENILLCCCHVGNRFLFTAPVDNAFQSKLRFRGLHFVSSRSSPSVQFACVLALSFLVIFLWFDAASHVQPFCAFFWFVIACIRYHVILPADPFGSCTSWVNFPFDNFTL